MPTFLAVTSRGLTEPLAAELTDLGLKKVKVQSDVVQCEAPWSSLPVLHLSRLANRFLLPVTDFLAYNGDDLYFGVLRRHDFTKYIKVDQTFRIDAKVRDHAQLRDQRFVAMRVKDAIADQFNKKFGRRPNVAKDGEEDLKIVVRVVGPKISLALDLTGESLSHRGYRTEAGEAPLRETVAAGLLRLAGWTPEITLLDPFCGSGTLLIEAALVAKGRAPQVKSNRFLFERLQTVKGIEFAKGHRAAGGDAQIFGSDVDRGAIEVARRNAKRAGVEDRIQFSVADMKTLRAPQASPGLLITNPPYGERLEDIPRTKELFSEFSHTLKREFKGWEAWILSGNREAITGLRLKAKRRIPVWNGPIECRFLNYPLS